MLESGLPADKHKVTLYISSDVRRQLKIHSAVVEIPMSELAEKAITFYLNHSDIVEAQGYGQTHRLHNCPDCNAPLVMRSGNLVSVTGVHPQVKAEDLSLCN
jgi:hypothetical protein